MEKVLIINTGTYFVNGMSNVITTYLDNIDGSSLSFYVTSYGEIDQRYQSIFEKRNVKILNVPNRRKKLLRYYKTIKKIIKREKIDIVHIHGNSATMLLEVRAAEKAGAKKIIVQSHNSSCSLPFLFGHNSFFAKKMNKKHITKIAVSKLVGDWLFGNDYIVVNNAIDVTKFVFNIENRKKIRNELKIDNDSFVIGHIGCFNKQKNQKFLISIFEQYLKINSNTYLILAGDGSTFEEIKKLINCKGLSNRVFLLGKIDNTDEVYNAFDIFVLPSLWEGLGVVNIEAQSNGLPCLVSNVVASDANVSDRFFMENINASDCAWATRIEDIRLKNINRCDDMNDMIVEHGYSIEKQANCLLGIYEAQECK